MKLKLLFSKGASPVLSNRKNEMLRKSQYTEERHLEYGEGSRAYAKLFFSQGDLI